MQKLFRFHRRLGTVSLEYPCSIFTPFAESDSRLFGRRYGNDVACLTGSFSDSWVNEHLLHVSCFQRNKEVEGESHSSNALVGVMKIHQMYNKMCFCFVLFLHQAMLSSATENIPEIEFATVYHLFHSKLGFVR